MPIYSYLCPQCGHAQDHLMKMADAAPACPACHGTTYAKQVTAAAFALKGSGYYATDFKHKPASTSKPSADPSGSSGCSGSCACHP